MDAPPPWAVPLLLRYFGLIALAIVGMLLVGVTHFDGRWIHPMVCVLPLLVFAARPALGRDLRGARRLVGATVGRFLAEHGSTDLATLLDDLGLDRDHLVDLVRTLAPPVLDAAREAGVRRVVVGVMTR